MSDSDEYPYSWEEWKRLIKALPFETERARHSAQRGWERDMLPAENLWRIALGEVRVYQLGDKGRAELCRVLEKAGIERPEEGMGNDAKGNKGKVAMTIRIGSLQTAALHVIAESRGQTIEQAINDIIKDAALELISRKHRNKDNFVRIVLHDMAAAEIE